SSTPSTELPEFGIWDLFVKKGGHFLGYALLGLMFWRGVGVDLPQRRWWALAAAFLYACSDEYHQWFVPGRNAWWLDVVIDTTGAFAAIFLLGRWNQLRNRLKSGMK
ncbi:MAG: VanZ family protein, partial [Anaerolineaceae bacterium]